MKRVLLVLIMLVALPFGLPRAAEITDKLNADLGVYFDSDAEAFGMSIEGGVKTAGGLLQFSTFGSFGEANPAIGFTPFLYLLEGGKFELAILQGVVTSWEGKTNYNAGISGAYLTAELPWTWPSYDKPITLFAKWYRQYPFDKSGAQEATGTFTIGVSL